MPMNTFFSGNNWLRWHKFHHHLQTLKQVNYLLFDDLYFEVLHVKCFESDAQKLR